MVQSRHLVVLIRNVWNRKKRESHRKCVIMTVVLVMIDSRLTKRFASHLKEADKVVMLSSAIRDFDDFGKVGRIFSLDVRVCQRKESEFKIKRKSEILRTNRVLNPQAI